MADISKILLPTSTEAYIIKDSNARSRIAALESQLGQALVFKGVLNSAAEFNALTNYKIGYMYKANAQFAVDGLGKLEIGDAIIAIDNYSTALQTSDFTVLQNNIDVMQGATDSSAGSVGLVPSPAIGTSKQVLKGSGNWGGVSTDILEQGVDTVILNGGTSINVIN